MSDHPFKDTGDVLGCAFVLVIYAIAGILFVAWSVVLPTIGILYLCGYLK